MTVFAIAILLFSLVACSDDSSPMKADEDPLLTEIVFPDSLLASA